MLGLSLALAEVGVAQNAKSQALMESDPSGLVMTITAVTVVFLALVMLAVCFALIGKLMRYLEERRTHRATASTEYPNAHRPATSAPSAEAMVAIALALDDAQRCAGSDEVAIAIALALAHHADTQHDAESYVVPIRRRPLSQWSARQQGMRQQVVRQPYH